jgi:hypothetical protein
MADPNNEANDDACCFLLPQAGENNAITQLEKA